MNRLLNRLRAILIPALTAVLMSTLSVTPAAAASTVYKWVDEKGIVNYTTTPPPAQRKAAVIDVAPAVTGRGALLDENDARYAYARDLREAASQMELNRLRSDNEQLRQLQLRQETAAAQRAARDQAAMQQAIERCRSLRHVDCETNPYPAGSTLDPNWLYPYRQIVVVRRPPGVTPLPRPYFSTTPAFTPGYSIAPGYSNPVR